jgi:hypothetical protein
MKVEDYADGSRGFWGGALFGMCLIIAANGVNWLITPMRHPNAGTAKTVAVIVQIVVAASVAIWLYLRQRRVPPLPAPTSTTRSDVENIER